MRIGKGPLKGIKGGYAAAETTVIVLTCIPYDTGYYEQSLDILNICLSSIIQHTDADYDLMVVDNGSIPKVTARLTELNREGLIDHLILNKENLGLSGALNVAFNAAPGKYIAFSNDDVLFRPGWLSAHIEIFRAFPSAGLVCGQTIPIAERQNDISELASKQGFKVSKFRIPDSWIERFARSVGNTLDQYLDIPWVNENRNTLLLEREGCKAYTGMTGYSHVFRKDILTRLQCFPFATGHLAGDNTDMQFARAIKALGLLWLCTHEKTTEHLGNNLDTVAMEKLGRYGLGTFSDMEDSGHAHGPSYEGTERKSLTDRLLSRLVRHRYTQKVINIALQKLIVLRSLRN